MRISDWSSDVCSSDLAGDNLEHETSLSGRQPTEGDMHEVQGQQPYGDVELAYAQRPHTVCSRASMYSMSTGSSLKTSGLPLFLITSMPSCHSSQRAIRPKVMFVERESPMKARSEEHTSELQSLMRI